MERLNEIEARMSEIGKELDIDGADLNALEVEIRALKEERANLNEAIAKRKALVDDVTLNGKVIRTFEEEKPIMEYTNASPEYRNAWLKNLQGKTLDEVEQRALTASAAMPEQTANKIVETMVDMVPLLNEIELFRIPGNLNIAVQTAAPAGKQEAAGGAVTVSTATLRQVALGGYNINAFIQVGADLAAMAIPAFEDWLVRKLSEGIAYQIENMIVNGDGNSAPKGIEYYATWAVASGNAVDWTGGAGDDSLDVPDIDGAIGLVPAAYDGESKFLMSKQTFYQDFIHVTDTNNYPIVSREGKTFFIRGYEVIFSDKVTLHDAFFGSFKRGMVGNLSSEIKVEKQRNLAYNAWDFLGWGVFDCEPAAAGCIIKIASDIAAA